MLAGTMVSMAVADILLAVGGSCLVGAVPVAILVAVNFYLDRDPKRGRVAASALGDRFAQ